MSSRWDRRATPDPAGHRPSESTDSATVRAVVVKLGGRSLDAPGALDELAAEVVPLSGGTLLVHGGGSEVSAWCERLGVARRFEDGLRVTDQATLEIAAAVLGGLANARLVAGLRAAGVDAVGLRGLDGGVVAVDPHPDVRLGHVGRVRDVDPTLLATLIAHGRTPVLASIGAHRGRLLNLNADEVAAAVAVALDAAALVLLSDTPGVRLGGAFVPGLTTTELTQALASPEVTNGMRPKLVAAHAAVAGGVSRVVIGSWAGPGSLAALLHGRRGTTCHPEPATAVSRV